MKTKKSDVANLENKRGIFFLIGLVIALGTVLVAFEWKTQPDAVVILEGSMSVSDDYVYIPPTPNEKRKIPPKMVEPPSFLLVDDDTKVEDSFDPVDSEPGDDLLLDLDELVFSKNKEEKEVVEDIFVVAEVMPEFPGGERAMLRYLGNKVNYPVIAQENGIKGKVYISFVVDEIGNINDVTVLRGVDVSLDKEALRVVRSMPKWKPGRQGGKAVKVRYNVPIVFELQ